MASLAAAKFLFFSRFFFLFGKKIVKIILKKKRRSQSALIDSPGRWTGNNIFSKGGLSATSNMIIEKW